MSGSAPSNSLFDVSTVLLILEAWPFLFPVRLLIVELYLLFPSVALFPVLCVYVDPSPLVSAAPPSFASGVYPLPTFSKISPRTHPMSGSAPSNSLFDVSTVLLILEAWPFLFPVRLLIVELYLLFPSVALFPVLCVYVDPSPLVSAAPPSFASGVYPLLFFIFVYHPIVDSERTIPGLFLRFGVKIFKFDNWFSYLFI